MGTRRLAESSDASHCWHANVLEDRRVWRCLPKAILMPHIENRVRQLEQELRRVERERDITTTPGADHSALDYLTPEEFEAGSR